MYSVCNSQITLAGLPHSDIPGSKLVYQLPEAFRRYPRPSSPVSAKASTVCPYSLDHISPSIHLEVCHRQDDKHGLPFLNCQRTIPLRHSESVVLSFFTRNSLLRTPSLSTTFYCSPYLRSPYLPWPCLPPSTPASDPLLAGLFPVVELTGLEPVTPCLQSRCSPN